MHLTEINNKRPMIGLGVLIYQDSSILLGERKSPHGFNTWGPPGGYLEFGETFEQCAIREVREEAGLCIESASFIGITNNIFTDETKHTVSIFMRAKYISGQEIINSEPDKISSWKWFDMANLPDNLFLPLRHLFETADFNLQAISGRKNVYLSER